MKKTFIFITLTFVSFLLFGETFFREINDNGDHKFSTTIEDLYRTKCSEEVCIQNNTSFKLNNIRCLIEIGGRSHSLKNINNIKIGDHEEFDGYEDDELEDELEHFFGPVAKWTSKNTNEVSFTLNFSDHNNDVIIKRIYCDDESLTFEIEDSSNAVTTEQQLEKTGAEILEIDGKKYLFYNGQVIEIK